MDIRKIDLNLLPVLDALLRHCSVTLAARELDMSQSALSASLARMRTLLGDPLFVRKGHGLAPTPRALALALPVQEILEAVRDRVVLAGTFDPAADARTFRVLLTDVGAYVLWPRLLNTFRRKAPASKMLLRVVLARDVSEELAEGRADLAIGSFPGVAESFFQRRLFERQYVCLMSRSHPHAKRPKITALEFANASHVVARMASGIQECIDEELSRQQLQRTDVLEVPSYLMAPPLVESAGYVCAMPGQLADEFARRGPFVTRPLPIKTPVSTIRMYWHRRLNEDVASSWFRKLVVSVWGRD